MVRSVVAIDRDSVSTTVISSNSAVCGPQSDLLIIALYSSKQPFMNYFLQGCRRAVDCGRILYTCSNLFILLHRDCSNCLLSFQNSSFRPALSEEVHSATALHKVEEQVPFAQDPQVVEGRPRLLGRRRRLLVCQHAARRSPSRGAKTAAIVEFNGASSGVRDPIVILSERAKINLRKIPAEGALETKLFINPVSRGNDFG